MRFARQLATGRAPAWGKDVADLYDRTPSHGNEHEAVPFLAELAGDGPALELAVGTGRVAIPLAATGIRVDGIDNSEAMVAKLKAKDGGERVDVVIGDCADVAVEGTYRLIYLVANTLGNLLTQDNQVRCFENVAAHLEDGGHFVVELGPPGWLYRLAGDQYVEAQAIDVDYVMLDTARHDPVRQTLEESHVLLTKDRVRLYPLVFRYVWPSEMDLMARVAGLRLKERWAGWQREPFTGTSDNCVSVYVK
jgi:SAM-dependent methyltransferase